MKNIVKKYNTPDEPQYLIDFKTANGFTPATLLANSDTGSKIWKILHNTAISTKTALKADLLDEQGFLCCYCQQRTSSANGQIDHFLPKDTRKDKIFDYDNLLGSCDGGNKERRDNPASTVKTFPEFCDASKGNHILNINPLGVGCESNFFYQVSWTEADLSDMEITIHGNNNPQADQDIQRLNLNVSHLVNKRRDFVIGFLFEVKDINGSEQVFELLDAPTLQILAQNYNQKNAQGEYTEFAAMLPLVIQNIIDHWG